MIIIDPFSDRKYHYKDLDFNEPVKIRINQDSFDKINKPAIVSTLLVFERCFFYNEVSVTNNGSPSLDFRISFKGCFVNSFNGSLISLEKNLSVHCFSSYFKNFNSVSEFVERIDINNCFGTFFIENCQKLSVTYSQENIFIKIWERLDGILNNILSLETNYYIDDVKDFTFNTSLKLNQINELSKIIVDKRELIEDYRLRYIPSLKEVKDLNISVSLEYSNLFLGKSSILNSILKSLTLSGKPNGELVIENTQIDNVFIHNFSPQETFDLMGIEPVNLVDSKFEVNNSILDNTWFYGINFNLYNDISFYKSSFVNAKITSCIFPNIDKLQKQIQSVKNIHYKKQANSVFYREQYDLFLELKQAFDKRGNIYESDKMKAVALKSLERVDNLDFWNEKIILIINKLSNNNGVSPLRALKWFCLLTIIFHTLNVLSFENVYFDFYSNKTFSVINENLKYLFVIANPTHKVSSLAPVGELTTGNYATSFVSRIFIGYIYYQFIVAFRRFGKF